MGKGKNVRGPSQSVKIVRALAEHLSQFDKGDVVTYDQLSEVAGLDVLKKRHLLGLARLAMVQEEGKVFGPCSFGTTPGKRGLRCLEDAEVALRGGPIIRQIERKAEKGVSELETVKDLSDLTPDQRAQYHIDMGVLAGLVMAARKKQASAIEAARTHTVRSSPTLDANRMIQAVTQ